MVRVLALHGFRTSAGILQSQVALAGLSKFFTDNAEVTYLDAPHVATGPAYAEVQEFFEGPFFEWWAAEPVPGSEALTCKGMDESVKFLEGYMRQHGPFDGLMGFSQGATLSFLAALLQDAGGAFQDLPRLKFVILIAGSKCKDQEFLARYGDRSLPCPAFVIVGEQDPHKEAIELLISDLQQPIVYRHKEGHKVPRLPAEQQQALLALMNGKRL